MCFRLRLNSVVRVSDVPDHSWICSHCGENNPPYTEACRNCYGLSPIQPEQVLPVTPQLPQDCKKWETFEEFVRRVKVLYFMILGILILGCVVASVKALILTQNLNIKSLGVPILMTFCVMQIRAYFLNRTVYLRNKPLPPTNIDSSLDNKEWRGLAAFCWLMFYLLGLCFSWQ